MERILVFICISSLVITFHITTGRKLSLRQGPPQEEPPGPIATAHLKNCTMCPRHYKPVCASNGHWYHNPCFMACEVGDNSSIGILYEGVCRPEHMHDRIIETTEPPEKTCANSCPDEYLPVCASNLKWYNNKCLMECDNAEEALDNTYCTVTMPPIVSEEHYRANCTHCSKVYDPVCMSDGKWYYNICMMDCIRGDLRRETVLYHGKCIHFL
ncbi:serine protease inhibitor dipetalogastin-like [Cydia pomonella]|uniref:serine protease inhibitor dipetalogastin-like n=1 Tax=Cydia pomonella TaxID=82600 RepID=UPI002ADE2938|nr:serine protease inhibitor dipetalogastin-like [Cydia pomonella]